LFVSLGNAEQEVRSGRVRNPDSSSRPRFKEALE
jgi:hypothetical protein